MRAVISKWGNSLALRLPKSVLEQAELAEDQAVEITVVKGQIRVKAVEEPTYDLDELLAQIQPGTKYTDVDFGPPLGKEIW
jgi:antitoxin MazE